MESVPWYKVCVEGLNRDLSRGTSPWLYATSHPTVVPENYTEFASTVARGGIVDGPGYSPFFSGFPVHHILSFVQKVKSYIKKAKT